MAARTRAQPRTRTSRARKKSSFRSSLRTFRIRPEAVGVVLAALALASLPFLVDLGEALSGARDWVARNFGLGIFLLVGGVAAAGMAISGQAYRNGKLFWRRTAGWAALLLFVWGLFGLNTANWSLGNVSFNEVTLGGNVGARIVEGFLGKVAWISLFVITMALLAPRFSLWFAHNVPVWIDYAWEQRWPHRVVGGINRWIRVAFQRPGSERAEQVPVIGGIPATHIGHSHSEDEGISPVLIRPNIDAAAPVSPVSIGAAAQFSHSVAAPPPPVELEDEPEPEDPEAEEFDESLAEATLATDEHSIEPQQLGLELEEKSGWQMPPMDLLKEPIESKRKTHDNAARGQLIVDTLASFGVDATVVEINEGPTVTQFGVEPGWEVRYKEVPLKDENGKTLIGADNRNRTERVEVGRTRVRVNKITTLQNDLALALAAPSLRIEAPVPGRAIVGIEVPNDTAAVVTMRSVMETKEFTHLASSSKLAIALGRGVAGKPIVADLAKMPHLLIAGATGSGKSVCMNAIITGIMMNATPDQVRFVMVDPKRVELTGYKGIPHMAFSEVIVDVEKVVGALQAVVSEMDHRYKKFAEMGVRNLDGYNRHPRVLRRLPQWVVIIDELADLMMAAPFEVEKLICRLAQLSRATGIHLVVATQRPSVDVITGLIKANFPTRIAFAVTSQTDSRTILDSGGAEKLLGRGDMLYMPTDAGKPIRVQGVYMSDAEVERLVEWWKDDRFRALVPETADALLEEALIERNGGEDDIEIDEDDPMLESARELTLQHTRISPAMLQRRLRIGYMKACAILDVLQNEGLVGSRDEGESRRVLTSVNSGVPGPANEGQLLD